MGLLRAISARPPQTHAAHPLRKRALDARARCISLSEGRGLLLLATGEQGLLGCLRTDVQHPPGRLRAGTRHAARAHLAGRVRKDNLNALWITQRGPAATLLPLWTRRTLCLPVDLEMGSIEALIGFRLPTVVGQDRTQQFDPIVLLAADQQLGIDIAGIHE